MNRIILPGKYHGDLPFYRSKNGQYDFKFKFVDRGRYFEIFCQGRPPLNGRDPSPEKTHVWPSGLICFVAGKEPRSLSEAKRLAALWSEYYLEYRRTGISQR